MSMNNRVAFAAALLTSIAGLASCTAIQSIRHDEPMALDDGELPESTAPVASHTQPASTPKSQPKNNVAQSKTAPAPKVVTTRAPATTMVASPVADKSAKRGENPAEAKASSNAQLKSTQPLNQVMMYVAVDRLNVRANPTTDSPVVGQLVRGSSFHVAIESGWAKLGDGKYVQVKYLNSELASTPSKRATFRSGEQKSAKTSSRMVSSK